MRAGVILCVGAVVSLSGGLVGCSPANVHRSGIVGEAQAPRQGVLADIAYPRIEGSKRYSFQRGSGSRVVTEYVDRRFELLDDGTWMVHNEEAGERTRSTRLARTARGVNLLETIEYGRNTHTFFRDGGLLLMPTEARPEGRYGNTVIVEIFDLDGVDRIRERGTATRTIEYLADEPIVTPAGTFVASRVRSSLGMELGTARVDRINTIWVEPDLGIVGEDDSMVVRLFGVPVQNENRLLLLAELPFGLRSPTGEVVDPLPGWLLETSPVERSVEPMPAPEPAQEPPAPQRAAPSPDAPIGQMTPVG